MCFGASLSGQVNRHLNLVASLHGLRGRWAYVSEDDGDPDTPTAYRFATFAFAALGAEYIDVDDKMFPRRGIGGSLVLRGGVEGAGSDASFAQVHARDSWFKGLGERNRLIVRGEIGHTFTDALPAMPPTLRFSAGGARSIRCHDSLDDAPPIGDITFRDKPVCPTTPAFAPPPTP